MTLETTGSTFIQNKPQQPIKLLLYFVESSPYSCDMTSLLLCQVSALHDFFFALTSLNLIHELYLACVTLFLMETTTFCGFSLCKMRNKLEKSGTNTDQPHKDVRRSCLEVLWSHFLCSLLTIGCFTSTDNFRETNFCFSNIIKMIVLPMLSVSTKNSTHYQM